LDPCGRFLFPRIFSCFELGSSQAKISFFFIGKTNKKRRRASELYRIATLLPKLHRCRPSRKRRELTTSRPVRDPGHDLGSLLRARNSLALKLAEERRILLTSKRTPSRRSPRKQIHLASPAQRRAALLIGTLIRRPKQLASVVRNNILYIVEHVALEDSARAGVPALEEVAFDVGPDVVDGVEQRLAAERGPAAGGFGDVVVLHGDGVAGADHLEDPVVVAVAAGGEVGLSVDEVAGEGDASAGCEAEDVVLAAGTGGLFIC
jgi:hypothetical protein